MAFSIPVLYRVKQPFFSSAALQSMEGDDSEFYTSTNLELNTIRDDDNVKEVTSMKRFQVKEEEMHIEDNDNKYAG